MQGKKIAGIASPMVLCLLVTLGLVMLVEAGRLPRLNSAWAQMHQLNPEGRSTQDIDRCGLLYCFDDSDCKVEGVDVGCSCPEINGHNVQCVSTSTYIDPCGLLYCFDDSDCKDKGAGPDCSCPELNGSSVQCVSPS